MNREVAVMVADVLIFAAGIIAGVIISASLLAS
jgi:hypothetical protein